MRVIESLLKPDRKIIKSGSSCSVSISSIAVTRIKPTQQGDKSKSDWSRINKYKI